MEQTLEKIKTLNEVFTFLSTCEPDELSQLKNQLDLDPDEFLPFQHWNETSYTRNCIKRTEKYEVLLLCWGENQQSQIHSHDGKSCLVYGVTGSMVERFYSQDNCGVEVGKSNLNEKRCSYISDKTIFHAFANESDAPAVTLHIYVRPITKCEIYDSNEKRFSTKQMTDHSFRGNIEIKCPKSD